MCCRPKLLLHARPREKPFQFPVDGVVGDHHAVTVECGAHGESSLQAWVELTTLEGDAALNQFLPCRVAKGIAPGSCNDPCRSTQTGGHQRSRRQAAAWAPGKARGLDFFSQAGNSWQVVENKLEKKFAEDQQVLVLWGRERGHHDGNHSRIVAGGQGWGEKCRNDLAPAF